MKKLIFKITFLSSFIFVPLANAATLKIVNDPDHPVNIEIRSKRKDFPINKPVPRISVHEPEIGPIDIPAGEYVDIWMANQKGGQDTKHNCTIDGHPIIITKPDTHFTIDKDENLTVTLKYERNNNPNNPDRYGNLFCTVTK